MLIVPILTVCPNPACGESFRLSSKSLGSKARCKSCDTRFRVQRGSGELLSLSASARNSAAVDSKALGESSTETGEQPGRSFPAETDIPALWAEGDVILDLYQVGPLLGEGGMGRVQMVRHTGWNRDLAVKSPLPKAFRSQQQKENFQTEAETWVNLGLHPHIVSCYYVRDLGGIPRVFVEYVDGGSLKDAIDSGRLYEGGPEQALQRILDIAVQFAWGLHYAHEQGLVHQDVKPANLMLTAAGLAKVTDFGLAKARAVAGLEEQAPGNAQQSLLVSSGGMTPAYCSPEQATKQPLSRKTDIWSWAVSVLEMFTGDDPGVAILTGAIYGD